MAALGEPFERVVPESIPFEVDYRRDTSLESVHLESTVETDPSSIVEALEAAGS